MERKIVGVLMEADYEGRIECRASTFDILKETGRLVYPVIKTGTIHEDSKTIGCLTMMRKSELGAVVQSRSATHCSYRAHNIIESPDELNALIDKVKNRLAMELERRVSQSSKWAESYEKQFGGANNEISSEATRKEN